MSSHILKLGCFVTLAMMLLSPDFAGAQEVAEGTWTAHFVTPGGEGVLSTFEVTRNGRSVEAVMKVAGSRMRLSEYRIERGLLLFSMDAGFVMDCRLERSSRRQYKGSCMDAAGYVGPAVVAPPGVAVTAEDVDLDKAFEVWGLSRVDYEREHFPERAEPQIAEPDPLPSRIVPVSGRGLNVVEMGTGDVTVVLVSGVGDDHQVWRTVQEALARKTRTVSYDRPGLGLSERSDAPRDPDTIARELREMLREAAIGPPFLLVGHEGGSLAARSFHAMYPEDLVGLVLVDPAHRDVVDRWRSLDSASWDDYVSRRRTFFSLASETAAREFEAFVDALEGEAPPEREGLRSIVISGQGSGTSSTWIGTTPAGLSAKAEVQRDLAERMPGEFIVSRKSVGNIHLEEPDLVVDAVSRILDDIEQK